MPTQRLNTRGLLEAFSMKLVEEPPPRVSMFSVGDHLCMHEPPCRLRKKVRIVRPDSLSQRRNFEIKDIRDDEAAREHPMPNRLCHIPPDTELVSDELCLKGARIFTHKRKALM
jgi:hypothetical protein